MTSAISLLVIIFFACHVHSQGNEYCSPNPCLNGGVCRQSGTYYACDCPLDVSGYNCDTVSGSSCLTTPCLNGGICMNSDIGYQCSCPTGYTGDACETTVSGFYCEQSPCQNGGVCRTSGTYYICECTVGFEGQNCEEVVLQNPCEASLCANGGICSSVATYPYYVCSCINGYSGSNCEIPTNTYCADVSPCQNGGACTASGTYYICACTNEFTGYNCETPSSSSVCSPNPCLNGGVCNLQSNGFTCICPSSYSGLLCETSDSSLCSPNPCLNGGVCLQESNGLSFLCYCATGYSGVNCENLDSSVCSPNQCLNDGICIVESNGFTCACPSSYSGLLCETLDSSVCSPNQCLNDGICIVESNGFTCACPSSYTGLLCETLVTDVCSPNPCYNGGTCNPFGIYYNCYCPTTYTGFNCETLVLYNEAICGLVTGLDADRTPPLGWPWLGSYQTSIGPSTCEASLIAEGWALTSASCIVNSDRVVFGSNSLSDISGQVPIQVQKVHVHPEYDPISEDHDIALLQLASDVAYTSSVRPICLSTNEDQFPPGTSCYVAGWSTATEGSTSDNVRSGFVSVISKEECQSAFSAITILDSQICIDFPQGQTDACQSRSGGPLMCYSSASQTYIQAGIVSFRFDCATDVNPGVTTRVASYTDFISDVLSGNPPVLRSCVGTEHQCPNNGICIDDSYVCNGVDNCNDGSDEVGCVFSPCSSNPCPSGQSCTDFTIFYVCQ